MKRAPGGLYAAPDSTARSFAEAVAWLWRLGPVDVEPAGHAVGFGVTEERSALARLIARGQLTGAIVFGATENGDGPVRPRTSVVDGVADLPDGSVKGRHTVFLEGRPVLRSRVGSHAVEQNGILYLGASPSDWGSVSAYWVFGLIADFLEHTLMRPLVVLPPLGCVRLDDVPGTALQQLRGRAHQDHKMVRRIRGVTDIYGRAGARLVVAVASEALVDGAAAPLDAVWPESVAVLADGVSAGVLELACHGTLHVDVEALAEGTVEPEEFSRLGEDEAYERIENAAGWLREAIGEPQSFIAPAWGYGPGTLAAAARSGLPAWCPPRPGPLLSESKLFETTRDSLVGITGVDYRFLTALARVGVPPTVVFHGRLLDHRHDTLAFPQDVVASARLAIRPDLFRMPRVPGVRWVGARDLVDALRDHDETELGQNGSTVVGPGSSRLLV